ncbi:MAG: hypothetical protein ACOC0X_02100, partial [Halobacteriota archaeon]
REGRGGPRQRAVTAMTASRQDWLVVGAVVIGLVIVPLALRFWPGGAPYRVALVALPLLPGIGLALVAVWYALRGGRS